VTESDPEPLPPRPPTTSWRSKISLLGAVLKDAGVEIVLSEVHVSAMNAYAERWVRTVRAEAADWLLITGPQHLRAGPGRVRRAL
jgi:hypothetical protein